MLLPLPYVSSMDDWVVLVSCLFVCWFCVFRFSRFCLPYCGLLAEPLAAVNVTCKCAFPFPATASHTTSLTRISRYRFWSRSRSRHTLTLALCTQNLHMPFLAVCQKANCLTGSCAKYFTAYLNLTQAYNRLKKALFSFHPPQLISWVIMVNSWSKPQGSKTTKLR